MQKLTPQQAKNKGRLALAENRYSKGKSSIGWIREERLLEAEINLELDKASAGLPVDLNRLAELREEYLTAERICTVIALIHKRSENNGGLETINFQATLTPSGKIVARG